MGCTGWTFVYSVLHEVALDFCLADDNAYFLLLQQQQTTTIAVNTMMTIIPTVVPTIINIVTMSVSTFPMLPETNKQTCYNN